MIEITRKVAKTVGIFTFLILMIVGVASCEGNLFSSLPLITLKAIVGFIIFWLFGIIISDTVIKAIITSIEDTSAQKWEGGVVSHFIPSSKDEIFEKETEEDEEE